MAIELPVFVEESFTPHWVEDQPAEVYHADSTAVSSGRLKRVLKSPHNFYSAFMQAEEDEEAQQPQHLRFGQAFHMAVLEPKKFFKQYIKIPEFKGEGSKAAKAEWFAAQPKSAVLVTEKEMIMLEGMVNSVLSYQDACNLLKHGQAEISGYYRDPDTGLKCKFRPDFMNFELLTMVDVKTTRDASAKGFADSVLRYRYDLQIAMYCLGVEQVIGKPPHFPIWLAIEKTPPYEVAVYIVEQQTLEVGLITYRDCMVKVSEALTSGKWPKMQNGMEFNGLPSWYLKRLKEGTYV